MIIYNVTIKLEESIHAQWFAWMKDEHIPEVIATGCFSSARMLRLLEVDESEGPTYAIQYHANSRLQYDCYIDKHAATLRQKTFDKWGNKFIAFRSLMQIVG